MKVSLQTETTLESLGIRMNLFGFEKRRAFVRKKDDLGTHINLDGSVRLRDTAHERSNYVYVLISKKPS
jgi:hypothetical protein